MERTKRIYFFSIFENDEADSRNEQVRGMVIMRISNISVLIPLLLFWLPACADMQEQQSVVVDKEKVSYLKVTGVAKDDTLNLRTEADSKSGLVAKLPYNANGILKLSSSGNWAYVSYLGQQGWVYGKYLDDSVGANFSSIFGKPLFCLGTEPHWTLKEKKGLLEFKNLDHSMSFISDSEVRTSRNETGIYSVSMINPDGINNHLNVIFKEDNQCSDGMSDDKYRYSVVIDDRDVVLYSGCCK